MSEKLETELAMVDGEEIKPIPVTKRNSRITDKDLKDVNLNKPIT